MTCFDRVVARQAPDGFGPGRAHALRFTTYRQTFEFVRVQIGTRESRETRMSCKYLSVIR